MPVLRLPSSLALITPSGSNRTTIACADMAAVPWKIPTEVIMIRQGDNEPFPILSEM